MVDASIAAVIRLFDPINFALLCGSVLLGLIIGILPGIGGMAGCTLLLIFVPYMTPEKALLMLIAFHSVTLTSGGITSILINIPGTAAAVVTTLDGFPMSQKGEGGRAIGACVFSSMIGGIIPVFMALLMIPLIMPIVLAFKTSEMCSLIIVGLSCLALLTGHSAMKGIISACLGILISLIGFQGATGIIRFSFGSEFLYDGIDIVSIALGLFGGATLLETSLKGEQSLVPYQMGKASEVIEGIKDVLRHKWLWFRCTLIGYFIGVLPGVGAETAIFLAYAHAKRSSKHPELFGTGVVEGVLAPEAADNAKEAGALLTTLAFGIPGSAVMAIFLGAFMMVGIIPGPNMMKEHLSIALVMLWGIALANLVGGLICLFSAKYLSRAAKVHFDFMFPVILILAFVGVYSLRESMINPLVVIIFSLLGLGMQKLGYSKPAFVLGFVLGRLFEKYLWLSIKFWGPFFFTSTISLILIGVVIIFLLYPVIIKVSSKRRTQGA